MELERQTTHRVGSHRRRRRWPSATPDQDLSWLLRELHDDIGQRIAVLAIELGMLRQRLTGVSADLDQTVARLAQDTVDIGSQVHRLVKGARAARDRSRHIELEQAIRGMFDALTRQRCAVEYDMPPQPLKLRPRVALALLRIGQEALHNIIRHSAANRVTVALAEDGGTAILRVVDDGNGFDPVEARNERTLGLTGMMERARAVGGRLIIDSAPGGGTRVEVRVPAT
jgi:two-component system sensor histidine kinase UhpB